MLGGCSASANDATTPGTSTTTTTATTTGTTAATSTAAPGDATTTTEPAWEVGAQPLPRRADGFGEVLPTPPALVERALRTVDTLPPPDSDRYESSVSPLTEPVLARIEGTWDPRCPVAVADLRYVTVTFRGFDGRAHTGELVVRHDVAEDVVEVFRRLHEADFPIEEMRLVTADDLAAAPTGDGNNTAGFVCRPAVGSTRWSSHAYGLAIDVNPFQNPYVRGDLVLPELASSYTDRSYVRPGMITPGDVVTEAFAAIGWGWGGGWASGSDPMHFSADGR